MDGAEARQYVSALAEVLKDCVDGGASVSFMLPFPKSEAERFFESVASDVEANRRILLAAFDGDDLVGTVQIVTAMPPNQPHRADISKLLVRRSARGRGIGASLMQQVEVEARNAGKSLLVLDTASAEAERVYTRQGWTRAGVIPDYALLPAGGYCDTVIFWKKLS